MEQKPATMNAAGMQSATALSARRMKSWLDLARNVEQDVDHEKRIGRQLCKACHYASTIAGAAMTSRACMSCGEKQLFGSTNTDVLCQPCANKGDLCKHCGADIALDVKRTSWPEAYQEKKAE